MAQIEIPSGDLPVREGFYDVRTSDGKLRFFGPELSRRKFFICKGLPTHVTGDIFDVTYYEKDEPDETQTMRVHLMTTNFGAFNLKESITSITTKDAVISFDYGKEGNTVFGGPIPKGSKLVSVNETSHNTYEITYIAPGCTDPVTMTITNVIGVSTKLEI